MVAEANGTVLLEVVPTAPPLDDAPGLARTEIDAVAAMLAARFPQADRREIDALVGAVYAELASSARVHAHLIPLTLNRCRRMLARSTEKFEGARTGVLLTSTGDAALPK